MTEHQNEIEFHYIRSIRRNLGTLNIQPSEEKKMNGNIAEEINLMDYFQVLRKRKWFIILGTLLCMVVAESG